MTFLVLDIETTGLDWKRDRLHGVAVCWGSGQWECEYYEKDRIPAAIRNALADLSVPKVGHNFRFDLKFLVRAGINIRGDHHDTRILGHLLDENSSTGLKELVPRYLGGGRLSDKAGMDAACGRAGVRNIAELCALDIDGNEKFPPGSFTNIISKYAMEDARNTYDLFLALSARVGEDSELARYYLEEAQPFERVLLDLELHGIKVDETVLDKYGAELRIEQARLEHEMSQLAVAQINAVEEQLYVKAVEKRKSAKGKEKVQRRSSGYNTCFLFSSTAHIGALIYEQCGAEPRRTAKGNWDTSEVALQAIANEAPPPLKDFLSLFFQWRGVQKNLSTYVDGLKEAIHDGRIHASYGQYTTTGRTHSSEPNMQNLPRGSVVKRAFVPAPGNVFVYFDYSQIELRIAAHLSQDPTMLSWFQRGIDPHQMIADRIGADRQVGKTMNFLTIYDGKAGRLHESLLEAGVTKYDEEDCKALLAAYWENVSGYRAYLDNQLHTVREERILRSITGRVRRLDDIEYGDHLKWHRDGAGWKSSFHGPGRLMESLRAYKGEFLSDWEIGQRASRRYSHAKKQAFNFPVQHLGATIMKRALMELRKQGFVVVTTVHDSATIELPLDQLEKVSEIQRIAESAYALSVPLKVDVKILMSLDEKDLLSLRPNALSCA